MTPVRELVPLLMVQDLAVASNFYRNVLGFQFTGRWEPGGQLAWCRMERDGTPIMLQQAEDEDGPADGRGHGVTFYFHCDDVDAFHAEVTSHGLNISSPELAFYGMKQVFLSDPDGYSICFQSPSSVPAASDAESER